MSECPMLDRYTLEVTLEFAPEAAVTASALQESVMEAIYDHSDRHRLLYCVLPDGRGSLRGCSVSLPTHDRIVDILEARRQRKVNLGEEANDTSGTPALYADQHAQLLDHALAVDRYVEELRTIQEKLNTAYTDMVETGQTTDPTRAVRRFDREVREAARFFDEHRLTTERR